MVVTSHGLGLKSSQTECRGGRTNWQILSENRARCLLQNATLRGVSVRGLPSVCCTLILQRKRRFRMPVTAKLSKQFYDRLGEAVTNELVDWFNQVDAAYKFDLREMNELNFARFDAKMEQRLTASEAKVEQRLTAFEAKIEQRLTGFEAMIKQRLTGFEAMIEQRLTGFEAMIEQRLTGFEAKIEQRLTALDAKIDIVAERSAASVDRALKEQMKFYFLAWAVLLASNVALWFR